MTVGLFLFIYWIGGLLTSFYIGGNRPVFWEEILFQLSWPFHLKIKS